MTGSQETVFLQGHIIDSLILAKVLDTILMMGGTFDLQDVKIGATRDAASRRGSSYGRRLAAPWLRFCGPSSPMGPPSNVKRIVGLSPLRRAGVFPEEFYATTHLPTQIRLDGEWVEVEGMEMDLGICVDPTKSRARVVPMGSVTAGELIVTGRDGIRVTPLARPTERDVFGFMESVVSSERPHQPVIADIAQRMQKLREWYREGRAGAKVLLAGGPAIVHAGGRDAMAWLVDQDYVQVLFCGNALAAHDMEAGLYGTSLGYGLAAGRSVPHGHEHHLRTINRIRAIGSIQAAVRSGVVTDGIMAACVRREVKMVMAGTIRDDGPLPGVLTDSMEAQQAMRAEIHGVGLALLVASTLHAIATGNLLPATIPTVCVDVNPAVPTKLADRGSFQAVGLVMDAASFLTELARELGWRP